MPANRFNEGSITKRLRLTAATDTTGAKTGGRPRSTKSGLGVIRVKIQFYLFHTSLIGVNSEPVRPSVDDQIIVYLQVAN